MRITTRQTHSIGCTGVYHPCWYTEIYPSGSIYMTNKEVEFVFVGMEYR